MISVYSYHNGNLDSLQRIFSYLENQESYGSADIHISPDGLFLYASNRLNYSVIVTEPIWSFPLPILSKYFILHTYKSN